MTDALTLSIPDVQPWTPETAVYPAAMAYGSAGLYLAPVTRTGQSPGKNPGQLLGAAWQTRTVTGGADAYALFGETYAEQACGIALHCGRSGLVVMDIDTEDIEAVPEPIRRAIIECSPPYQTTRIGAERRGHYLFRQPEGRMIGNSPAGLGREWGDIRGKNGVIILAGSWHPAPDGRYEWQRTGVIPFLPGYVADLLTDGSMVEGAFTNLEVDTFLARHVSNLKPQALKGVITKFHTEAGAHGRHTSMIDAACWAMREVRAGLYPGATARFALAEALAEAVAGERDTGNEMRGILAWAVAQVEGQPDIEARCAELREKAIDGAPVIVNEDGGEELDPHPLVLPSPNDPARAARELAALIPSTAGVVHAAWWRDDFYSWSGTDWRVLPAAELEGWLYRKTEHAEYVVPAGDEDDEAEDEYRKWRPNIRKIAEVVNALAKLVLQRTAEDDRVLACVNGVVRLDGGATLVPHHPEVFNLTSLPFAYDPDAACPRWLAFLEEALPGDAEAHDFLGEWFGYVLSGRTDQQKIASLIGKRRGGKGTIARVLTAMLGKEGVTAPDITDLGSHFGRASLIGKSLAVLADVRWNSNLSSEALKTFLAISGEDTVTIPRKHKDDWTGRSGLRFMVMSNDVPSFADRSNAIGTRMIHVKFDVTFEGREDFGLEAKLMAELPGILNWALAGLARLDAAGRFTVPRSGIVISQEMEENANPVATFVLEMGETGAEKEIEAVTLLAAYNGWAERRSMKRMEIRTFLAALRHIEGVSVVRKRWTSGAKVQVVQGATVSDIWAAEMQKHMMSGR